MNKLNIDQLKTIILASIILILGIFFCCSLSIGIRGLSVVIGIILLICGIVFIVNAILSDKNLLNSKGLIGVGIITLGIVFIAHKLAGIIFMFIPWFLIIVGIAIVIDSLLGKFSRGDNGTTFIVKLVLGCVSILLGVLLLLIDGFIEYASLLLGIVLIIFAVYIIISCFIKPINNQKL
jgi:uncharacterized membrane protein HdeD (DUF308 family)